MKLGTTLQPERIATGKSSIVGQGLMSASAMLCTPAECVLPTSVAAFPMALSWLDSSHTALGAGMDGWLSLTRCAASNIVGGGVGCVFLKGAVKPFSFFYIQCVNGRAVLLSIGRSYVWEGCLPFSQVLSESRQQPVLAIL
jgi:hypothetical protein